MGGRRPIRVLAGEENLSGALGGVREVRASQRTREVSHLEISASHAPRIRTCNLDLTMNFLFIVAVSIRR